ncbi:MAG: hypothetical protein PUB98_00755 [Clostridiales bacterium]|nr:hypothetical protein [Clostridiales bacterium]
MKKVTKLGAGKAPKAKKKLLRVAAYCHVSTDSDAQLESLEAQKQHYENYISGRDDWEFAGLYFEMLTPTLIQMHPTCTQIAP